MGGDQQLLLQVTSQVLYIHVCVLQDLHLWPPGRDSGEREGGEERGRGREGEREGGKGERERGEGERERERERERRERGSESVNITLQIHTCKYAPM